MKDFLVGALVGIMSMMPGASGGTIAVIFGIYERLIADLADIRHKLLKDLRFIIPVGLGIVVGLLVCAVGIDALLQNWEVPMMFFFAVLILCQIPDIAEMANGEEDGRPTTWNIVACIVGIAVMVAFLFVGSNDSGISLVELDAVDMVLLVDAPLETRIRRAMARDGADRESVEARIRSQKCSSFDASGDSGLPDVDFIIENSGTEDELRYKVEQFIDLNYNNRK